MYRRAALCLLSLVLAPTACREPTAGDIRPLPGGTLFHLCEDRPHLAEDAEAWQAVGGEGALGIIGPTIAADVLWQESGPLSESGWALEVAFDKPIDAALLYEPPPRNGCPRGTVVAYARWASASLVGPEAAYKADGYAWVVTNTDGEWVLDGEFIFDAGGDPLLDEWASQEVAERGSLLGYRLFVQGHPAFGGNTVAMDIEYRGPIDNLVRRVGLVGLWAPTDD